MPLSGEGKYEKADGPRELRPIENKINEIISELCQLDSFYETLLSRINYLISEVPTAEVPSDKKIVEGTSKVFMALDDINGRVLRLQKKIKYAVDMIEI